MGVGRAIVAAGWRPIALDWTRREGRSCPAMRALAVRRQRCTKPGPLPVAPPAFWHVIEPRPRIAAD